jgi:ABC-type branched-subunit amino acid transport system substrate-binding protein
MALLRRLWQFLNERSRKTLAILKSTVLSPLIGSLIGIVIISRLTGIFTGPDNYVIYFVGPLGGDTSLLKMENTFRAAPAHSLNGVPVKFEELDDSGDPAIAHSIAAQLAKRNNTLLVVGHVLSSTTKEALPIYMNANPPIPVILTTETNPQILPSSTDPDQEYPVFRLSPTDDDQAKCAFEFARKQHGTKFWVVEDAGNAVYSRYLAEKFLEEAQNNRTAVLLFSSIMNLPSAQTVDHLGTEWVFLAGDWRSALTLIRETRASGMSGKVRFILSDSSATQELLDNGGPEVEGVYLMHQLKASVFRSNNQGYGVYASYALEIIDRLLKKADQRFSELARQEVGAAYLMRKLLQVHRVSDARAVLDKCMIRSMTSPYRLSNGEVFRFRKEGTREDARFNVWRIANHQFQDFTESEEPPQQITRQHVFPKQRFTEQASLAQR